MTEAEVDKGLLQGLLAPIVIGVLLGYDGEVKIAAAFVLGYVALWWVRGIFIRWFTPVEKETLP